DGHVVWREICHDCALQTSRHRFPRRERRRAGTSDRRGTDRRAVFVAGCADALGRDRAVVGWGALLRLLRPRLRLWLWLDPRWPFARAGLRTCTKLRTGA